MRWRACRTGQWRGIYGRAVFTAPPRPRFVRYPAITQASNHVEKRPRFAAHVMAGYLTKSEWEEARSGGGHPGRPPQGVNAASPAVPMQKAKPNTHKTQAFQSHPTSSTGASTTTLPHPWPTARHPSQRRSRRSVRGGPVMARLAKRARRARSVHAAPAVPLRDRWGSYADCRALHSQRPTGSLSIMTLVPSTSVRQKSLNTWIHTPWLKVFLGEPSASRYTPVRSSTWSK